MKNFETVSFHIVKPCNAKCKFCYATFNDMKVEQISLVDARCVVRKLKDNGVEKITFAGGEPLLYKYISEIISYSKEIGLVISIITNGSLLTDEFLIKHQKDLDWIGLSIDSLSDETNFKIGRVFKDVKNDFWYYKILCSKISHFGYKLKVNTVINRFNFNEDFNFFIHLVNPSRWKVFQALRVEGQNENSFDNIKVSKEDFDNFIFKHKEKNPVFEDNDLMTGSYLLIDPQGRLFENSKGTHTYSKSLIDNNFDNCIKEINLNRDTFIKRGGLYEW